MKNIFIPILFLLSFSVAFAQDENVESLSSGGGSYQPTAGSITASLNFGQGTYFSNIGSYLPNNWGWNVGGGAPYINMINTNSNPITNMAGIEARYFLSDKMAIRASGGGLLRNVPYRVNVPGYQDPDAPISTWTPNYSAVVAYNQFDANLNVGFEYHLQTDFEALRPYAAIVVPFAYSRASAYDMTVDIPGTASNDYTITEVSLSQSGTGYDITFSTSDTFDPGNGGDPNDNGYTVTTYENDLGPRHVQTYAFGAQAVAGLDYYIKDGFYIGVEIKPLSWMYAGTMQYRTPGYPPRLSDSQTWSFFTQPFVKMGFRVFQF